MDQKSRKKLRKLSLDFTKDMYKDEIKRFILPAKILLESLYCWPDNNSFYARVTDWFIFFNIALAAICHGAYLFRATNEMSVIISVAATFNALIETLVRVHIILTNKGVLNKILVNMWKEFWPTRTLRPEIRKQLQKRALITFALAIIFLATGTTSTIEITSVPLIKDHELALRSSFPFDLDQKYIYAIAYVYQYFLVWYCFFMISTFDLFFVSIVTICVAQFVVLQEVLRYILSRESGGQRRIIFGDAGRDMAEGEVLSKCLKQHLLLLSICNDMEEALNRAILIQFVETTIANCAGFLIMKIDYSQFSKMLFYVSAHLVQLFNYCYVGEQLSCESIKVADAAYECNWDLKYKSNFRKALMLIMQRGQKKISLTAVGLKELGFASFVQILRTAFSFFTLLNTMLIKSTSK